MHDREDRHAERDRWDDHVGVGDHEDLVATALHRIGDRSALRPLDAGVTTDRDAQLGVLVAVVLTHVPPGSLALVVAFAVRDDQVDVHRSTVMIVSMLNAVSGDSTISTVTQSARSTRSRMSSRLNAMTGTSS